MIKRYINDLEKKLLNFIKETNRREKKAKNPRVKHYFEGQGDAFEQVLIELKNIKYEVLETASDAKVEEASEEQGQDVASAKGAEGLLQQAIENGIMERKASHYYYEDFPNGRIQGRDKVLAAISEPELYEKLRSQLDESQDSV